MNEVTLDYYASAMVEVAVLCPECDRKTRTSRTHSAWTEGDKLVVVPVECQCGYSGTLNLVLDDGLPF